MSLKLPFATPAADPEDKRELIIEGSGASVEDPERDDGHLVVMDRDTTSPSFMADSFFDGQQDILEVFDYDKNAYHSYWVYVNYTAIFSVMLYLSVITVELVGACDNRPRLRELAAMCLLVVVWFGLFGCYHFLFLCIIKDSKESPHTAITRSGIRHIQPPSRKGSGGELFIPFRLVQDVTVLEIKSTLQCLAPYHISRVDIATNLEDATSLMITGIARVVPEREDRRNPGSRKIIKIRIKGLRDGERFKRLVMAGVSEDRAMEESMLVLGLSEGETRSVSQTVMSDSTDQSVLEGRPESHRQNGIFGWSFR